MAPSDGETVVTCGCGHSHGRHMPKPLGSVFIVGECIECDCEEFHLPSEGRKT